LVIRVQEHFLLSASSPRIKKEVSKVLKSASAGRIFKTRNWAFYALGFSLQSVLKKNKP